MRSVKSTIQSLSKDSAVYYKSAKYSYSELIDTMTSIYNYCESEEYEKQDYVIGRFCIDDSANRVTIGINKLDETVKQHVLRNIENSDAVVFELCEEKATNQATTIYSGSTIGLTSGGKTCSVAFRARLTQSNGTVIKLMLLLSNLTTEWVCRIMCQV